MNIEKNFVRVIRLISLGEFLNENGETIIDEEEYELIAKLQELKGIYRTDYDQWKNLKSEISYCQNSVKQCQNRLLQGTSHSRSQPTTNIVF